MPRDVTHEIIDAEDFLHRYLTQRLSEEDQAAFEEHLLVCADCETRVLLEEGLMEGFREVGATDTAPAPAWPPAADVKEPGTPGARRRYGLVGLGILAAAVLVAALLPYLVRHPTPATWTLQDSVVRAEASQRFVLSSMPRAGVVLRVPVKAPYYRLLLHRADGKRVGRTTGETRQGFAVWVLPRVKPGLYDLTVDASQDGETYAFSSEQRIEVVRPE